MYSNSAVVSRNSIYALALLLVFCLSFSAPFFVAVRVMKLWAPRPAELSDQEPALSDVTSIGGPQTYLSVGYSPELFPTAGKDYLMTAWVRPSRLPQNLEKMMFIGGNDPQVNPQAGILLGLARDEDRLRPIVYWGSSKIEGHWFTFSDVDLFAQSWILLALSFLNDKYVGLHLGYLNQRGQPEVKLLGGYEVEQGNIPDPRTPLFLGAWGNSRFRGKVGPFGVFQRAGLEASLKDILRRMVAQPLEVPAMFDTQDVKLWAPTTRNDHSSQNLPIQILSPLRK